MPNSVAIFVIGLAVVSTAVAQRSSYGEPCNATTRCERRSWLGCINGTCGCLQPDDMIYNPNTRKCAAKAGERCRYAVDLEPVPARYEVTDCIENSTCGPDGFCTCRADYFEMPNGTCVEAKKHGKECNEHTKCSSTAGLECTNGTCQCPQGSPVYSPKIQRCAALAGKNCINMLCTDGARCVGYKCVCNPEYYTNWDDSTCVRKKGIFESCSQDLECENHPDFNMRCINGTCICNPGRSVHGTAKRRIQGSQCNYETVTGCLGKIGMSCVSGLCVPGASCDSYSNKCNCEGGYVARQSKTSCGKPHGGSCEGTLDTECVDGLICQNKVCQCPYDQIYDHSDGVCIAFVGGPCSEYSRCVPHALCRTTTFKSESHCICKTGFIENSERRCDLAHGERCNGLVPCDTLASLQCINGTCQCSGFMTYSSQTGRCVGLVGAVCDENLGCVDNATCRKERVGARGKCVCDEGFIETSGYRCEAFEQDLIPTLPTY